MQNLEKDITDIYLINTKSLKSDKLTDGKWYIEPKWSKDSKKIFFFSTRYENDLYIYDLKTNLKKKLTNHDLVDRHISIKQILTIYFY